jgi:hypothetical protein
LVESILVGLVGVVGTLLGSVTTQLFQLRAQRRRDEVDRREWLRQEQISVFSEFAGLLTDFRRSQNDRWHRERDDPGGPLFREARDESYRLRAHATTAIHRVELISDDSELVFLAQAALEAATMIPAAAGEDDRAQRGERAREAVHSFVRAASVHIQ